jgi:ABC-2 type transport system ATP-binding protein
MAGVITKKEATGMEQPLLEIRQLTKRFGTFTAVNQVSCSVRPGRIVGLLGPNGAGKTTLLSMLVGLLLPTAGTIVMDGQAATRVSTAMKHFFGFVPDSQDIIAHLTGWEYLQFLCRVYGLAAERQQLIRDYLALLHMESKAHDLLETYSHGQRKKIQLIAALLHQPRLLLLDEPLSGLDPEMILLVKSLLRKLREKQVGILFSTHDLLMAEQLCDEVVLLNEGQVIACGEPAQLRQRYEVDNLEAVFVKALGLEQQEEGLEHVVGNF